MDLPPPKAASGSEPEANGDELGNEQAEQVFGNSLLREKIFQYALYDKGLYGPPRLYREDVCNFRMVSKSWKEAVSQFLEKKKEPLYLVKMTETNSLKDSQEVESKGKVLDNFVRFLDTIREHSDSYAGFCLKMRCQVFRLENYDHVLNSLGQCGQNLVEMELNLPTNGTFPGLFPNTLAELTKLRKLKLSIWIIDLSNVSAEEKLKNPLANIALLIQSLLQLGNSTLKDLEIGGEWIPSEFQYIKLPPSLVTLELLNSENRRLWECLTRNHLPELRELTLRIFEEDRLPDEDLMFQIFENLRRNLRVLSIREEDLKNSPTFRLRFPVMENLERLHFNGDKYELAETATPFGSLFPKLTHVELRDVDKSMVNQFSSPITSVTTLEIVLLNYEEGPVPLDVMQGTHLAFPNITDLNMHHYGENFADLHYVFREMRQLKRLTIRTYVEGRSEYDWDSLLIGAPVELVNGLKSCPRDFWKDFEMNIKTGHSINMLKELAYLRLCACRFMCSHTGPLISDLAFIYALNGMPKLEHVELGGRFSFEVSKEIVEGWEERGRKIEYTAF